MSSTSNEAGWLPPSPEPIVPAEVGPDNPVWYVPPRLPQPGESRFFIMKQGLKSLVNYGWREDDAVEPFASTKGDRQTIVRRSALQKPKSVNNLADGSPRLISDAVMDVFLEFDASAIERHKVVTTFKDGELTSYFININRRIAAIDYANSKTLYMKSEGYDAYPASCGPARLLESIPNDVHVFLDARKWTSMFVSREIRDRIMSSNSAAHNVAFYDPAENSFVF